MKKIIQYLFSILLIITFSLTQIHANQYTNYEIYAQKQIAGELNSIEGYIYLDGNVSRSIDEGESAISNISLSLKDKSGKIISEATSDSKGYYKLEHILSGDYQLIISKKDASISGLSYYSKEPSESDINDCAPINEAINLKISGSVSNNIGLMQGWVTNPFHKEAKAVLKCPVDLDYRENSYRDFRNVVVTDPRYLKKFNGKPWGNDQHPGIDWDTLEGTPILSVAPGVVVGVTEPKDNGAYSVSVLHRIGYL